MADDIAIIAQHVYKDFKLPHEKKSSIKSFFTSLGKNRKAGYEVQHALKDISFEVKKGEFFGIVGRNGSGKSTLLKIIAEIYRPTRGKVHVFGRLVPFIELGVGFNPELTGRENVYLSGALSGFSTKEVDAMYDDIVSFAELEDFMDQKLKNYSTGMQVRLAFSVARCARADILLIDEVLAVGDSAFQKKCFNYFMQLKKEKKTVILVTHDMEAVRQYCDRAILIKDSAIISEGRPDKVAEEYIRQFSDEDRVQDDADAPDRWGNKKGAYSTVKMKVTEKDIEINVVFTAHEELIKPVFGLSIENSAGQALVGTNTRLCRTPSGNLSKRQRASLVWKMPNIFTTGDYVLNLAATEEDGSTSIDWWNGAHTFTVTKSHPTPYIVYPPYTVDVSYGE
jgi:ABC-2 type transport system ATP-binding protein